MMKALNTRKRGGSKAIKKIRKSSAVALLILITLALFPITAAADEYPSGGTFNGMQISYSISGVSIEGSSDVSDFTTSRSLTGAVTAKTVSISATVKQENGYSASISANCGGKTYSKEIQVGESDSFSLSVPVTKDMETVSISISMTGFYNAGTRGLVVEGTFINPNYNQNAVISGTPTDTADGTGSYHDPQLDFLNVPGPDSIGQFIVGALLPALLTILLSLLPGMGFTGPDNPLASIMGGGFTDGATHVLTSLDGKEYTLHYNAAAGGWCYENGEPFSEDGWNEAQRQIIESNEFRNWERVKTANHDTAFDRELDKMLQQQKEKAKQDAEKSKLYQKYGTADKQKISKILEERTDFESKMKERWMNVDRVGGYFEDFYTVALVGADTSIDTLAKLDVTGIGKYIQAGYRVTKGTLVGAMEAHLAKKSIAAGTLSGLIKGGSHALTDATKSKALKFALNVGGDTLGGAITDGTKGAKKGLVEGLYKGTLRAATNELAGSGYQNGMTSVNQIAKAVGRRFTVKSASGLTDKFVIKPKVIDPYKKSIR